MGLDFEMPDHDKFPAINLAYEALERGNNACIAMNAANEIAVQAFIEKKISYLRIVDIVSQVTRKSGDEHPKTLEDVIELDEIYRKQTLGLIK